MEISGGTHDIPSDKLMVRLINILLDEVFKGLPLTTTSSSFYSDLKDSINFLTLVVD